MGIAREHELVLPFIAAFSKYKDLLQEAENKAVSFYGPILCRSEIVTVDQFTNYYHDEMGAGLFKQLWAFENLIDPAVLPDFKNQTNDWEMDAAQNWPQPESDRVERPLNLDPGYIETGKLILATTKDHAHRIYLRNGIFAEITLMYQNKQWKAFPWTYPDYQCEIFLKFINQCREYVLKKRKKH